VAPQDKWSRRGDDGGGLRTGRESGSQGRTLGNWSLGWGRGCGG
jgi:hypothetical protein